MSEPPEDFDDFDDFDDADETSLDEQETALVHQDLEDLSRFEATFGSEGYRGVSVFCRDCDEEHYYPWDMLRENLTTLLETGETPVHEPAFAPDPDDYVPWQYARGYVDALHDAGVSERVELDRCPRCGLALEGLERSANFCARCGVPLMAGRLEDALEERGLTPEEIVDVLRRIGLPR